MTTKLVSLHAKPYKKANMISLKNVVSLLVMMIYFTNSVTIKSPYKKVVFGTLPVHASSMEKLEMMVLSLANEKMIIRRMKLWKLTSVLILPAVIQPTTHAKRLVFCILAYFNLHIQCKTSDKAPIIHIGPKADARTDFFADVKFNNTHYEHKEEHLHIQECTYTEYDSNDKASASAILIEDGCDVSMGLAQFKGNYLTILYLMTFIVLLRSF